jgi:hypothetical protein
MNKFRLLGRTVLLLGFLALHRPFSPPGEVFPLQQNPGSSVAYCISCHQLRHGKVATLSHLYLLHGSATTSKCSSIQAVSIVQDLWDTNQLGVC